MSVCVSMCEFSYIVLFSKAEISICECLITLFFKKNSEL